MFIVVSVANNGSIGLTATDEVTRVGYTFDGDRDFGGNGELLCGKGGWMDLYWDVKKSRRMNWVVWIVFQDLLN